MSHQDYVSRPRTQNKKKNPYKKKSTEAVQEKKGKSKLIILILLIIIGASAYGLWFLKNNVTTKDPISSTSTIESTNSETTKLPTLPKEKWTYIDQLANKQVEVGKYKVTQNGPYKMQCGSFRSQTQAESLKAKMAFIGVESSIHKAQGKTSLWYQVVLGPYKQKRTAEKDKHKLKNNKINGCQIWLWK